MPNLIIPQEISFTESYPGGTSLKIYGVRCIGYIMMN